MAAAASQNTSEVVRHSAIEDPPPFAVENFDYPGADRILAEQGITLKRGDGRIVLADCNDSADQIQVWTRVSSDKMFCFRSTAETGHLTMEISDVYAIKTVDRAVRAELSAEGKTQTVDVAKNEFKGVGEGIGDAPTVLLELRVTG